jgi:inorganic pyrophosphatase
MEDEAGGDAKLVAVPHDKLTNAYSDVKDIDDLPQLLRDQIQHFFENYKTLEPGKWVKVQGWANAAEAKKAIEESVKAYKG